MSSNKPVVIDEGLYQYATEIQLAHLKAINKYGSINAAARETNVARSTIQNAKKQVERKAAVAGYSPEHDLTHTVAPGQNLKGASTLYGPDGEVKLQWVKTERDREQQFQIAEEFINSLVNDIKGKARKVPKPKTCLKDMLAMYPVGDPHIGMYSWNQETGEDYDLKIAEQDNLMASERIVEVTPAAKTAIILPLGDIFHSDNQENRTRRSGAVLDVDGRLGKVVEVGQHIMTHKIDTALKKHQQVIVKCMIGNHDEVLAQMLSFILAAYYHNEKRVQVDISPNLFWYYEFGKVLLGSTHGHTVKAEELAEIMATDQPEAWGRTLYRHWLGGHIHHKRILELRGCTYESFNTLASKDNWHHSEGYRAKRNIHSIIYHNEYGETERHIIPIEQIRSEAA